MKNIFVGNLDFAATESSIRSLFEPYGQVDRVNLVTDRDTGRSRGFAFVEMTDSAAAPRRRRWWPRLRWRRWWWPSQRRWWWWWTAPAPRTPLVTRPKTRSTAGGA